MRLYYKSNGQGYAFCIALHKLVGRRKAAFENSLFVLPRERQTYIITSTNIGSGHVVATTVQWTVVSESPSSYAAKASSKLACGFAKPSSRLEAGYSNCTKGPFTAH